MVDFDERAGSWDLDPEKVERARRVAQSIRAQVGPTEGLEALEFGCGTGLLGLALQPHLARVTLADTSQGMLGVLRGKITAAGLANVTALELDLTAGPLPPDRYDLVVSLMALHHVPDVDGLLVRFHDILRPGGRVCLSDLDPEDGSFHGPGAQVHTGFDRNDLAARLVQAGFAGVRFTTPFVIERPGPAGPVRYPLFLAVAERA